MVGRDDPDDPTEDEIGTLSAADPMGGEDTDDDGESAKRGLSEREVKALMRDFSVGRLTAAKMGYAWLQMIRCSGTPLGEFAQEFDARCDQPRGGDAAPDVGPVPSRPDAAAVRCLLKAEVAACVPEALGRP